MNKPSTFFLVDTISILLLKVSTVLKQINNHPLMFQGLCAYFLPKTIASFTSQLHLQQTNLSLSVPPTQLLLRDAACQHLQTPLLYSSSSHTISLKPLKKKKKAPLFKIKDKVAPPLMVSRTVRFYYRSSILKIPFLSYT